MWGSEYASLMVQLVQLPEVDAEPQAAILLVEQDQCASPWTV